MSEFAEKVKSLGTAFHKGGRKTTTVIDDRDGSVAGKQIEHWSDRVDGVALPKTTTLKVKQEG